VAHRGVAAAVLLAASVEAAPRTFLVRFGLDRKPAVDWSGSVSPAPQSMTGWQFDQQDSLSAPRWKAATRDETYWETPYEASMKGTTRLNKVTMKGVVIEYPESFTGPARISTAQGEFSFSGPGTFLDGRVSVSTAPSIEPLTRGPDADDYPSLLETRDATFLLWQVYEKDGDRIYARRRVNGSWLASEPLTAGKGDFFRTALAQDKRGHVWAVWSAQVSGNFDLYGRRWDGLKWLSEERITSAPAADIYHTAVADRGGNVHLAWQAARDGNFDIYTKSWDGTRWSAERKLSESTANDWELALAAAPDGSVMALWDTYGRGNYDIVMRPLRGGRVTPLVNSGAFEARVSAQYDAQGRLWIGWDEGDWNWGKDYGQGIIDKGRGLMVRRQARVAMWANGRLQQPAGDLSGAVPAEYRQAFQSSKLVLSAGGAPRVFFRFRVNTPVKAGGESARTMWRQGTTVHNGAGWDPMTEFPGGYGRIDAGFAATGSYAVWATDNRPWPSAATADQDLMGAGLPADPARPVALTAFAPNTENLPDSHPTERADLARIRGYRATVNGKQFRIVRGDVHRHTDISWDGNRDGSLHDAYRYALDAVGFEYLGVCDHQAGNMIAYNWWMIQKAVDLFSIPGTFAPLYSYERSLPYPNGHRNVLFAERGRPVLEISQAEQRGTEGAAKLYEYLRKFSGLTTSHTSATGAGTDWRDSNEELEPVVEIYQGYRRNYEGPGTPRSPGQGEEPSRFAPGYVWNAWSKGIKLGVQSSSDHVSTHVSYAAMFVESIDRQSILDAVRARRAYAATDNIVVDFRVGSSFAGAAGAAQAPVHARVLGTGPIARVVLVRNNRVIYTHPGSGAEVRFDYTDADPGSGERYYYVRVEQQDGQLAWSSPVWVK